MTRGMKRNTVPFSKDDLLQMFEYDELTGVLTWRDFSRKKTSIAGLPRKDGRLIVSINREKYFASNLIWLIMTGEWPLLDVDHKDGDPTNNKWGNLRLATRSQNLVNRHGNRVRSLPKGVYLMSDGRAKPFKAKLQIDRKEICVGYFPSAEEAKTAYEAAALLHFGEFAKLEQAR